MINYSIDNMMLLNFLSILFFSSFQSNTEALHNTDPDSIVHSSVQELGAGFSEDIRLSIGISIGNEEVFFGYHKDNDSLSKTELADHTFEIGSITKVFTAHLFSSLIAKGVINQDQKLLEFIGVNNEHLKNITLEQLVYHTSGLARLPNNMNLISGDPYADYDDQRLYEYLESIDKEIKSTDLPAYSNLGYGLLGYVFSKVTNKSLEELYKEYIFDPVGMSNSSTHLDSIENLIPAGKGPNNNPGYNWNFQVLGAAGAIKSSAAQLLRYISWIRGENPIQKRLFQDPITAGKNITKTFGLYTNQTSIGQEIYWHNGGTGGYRSCMAFSNDREISVVVLSNVNIFDLNSNKIDALCFKIIEELMTKQSD